jgi:hypothetical protein
MKKIGKILVWVFGVIAGAAVFFAVVLGVYFYGYYSGYNYAAKKAGEELSLFKINVGDLLKQKLNQPSPTPTVIEKPVYPKITTPTWTGPELWEAVNKKRQEYGVNPLSNKSELCTIASIRLNELLALGTLDGHEGFSKMPDTRADLKWIFEKYNLTEFLVSGAQTADEAVSLWDNTLGHKKLLTGGEYVWGCIYAQDGFGVAITAY